MASDQGMRVLELAEITPPPGAAIEMSLPLTFLDLPWFLSSGPVQRLIFYELPISTDHFEETIIPKLKHALSNTLKYFLPFAGKLVLTSDSSELPTLCYVDGGSITLTFCECNKIDLDFRTLLANHPKCCEEFHPFVPQLPPCSYDAVSKSMLISPLAVQVTVFPNSGICIGIISQHSTADAATLFRFTKAWSSICKIGGEPNKISSRDDDFLMFYDRTVIQDPKGLAQSFWSHMRSQHAVEASIKQPWLKTTAKLRATFNVGQADIDKLKRFIKARRPLLAHISKFTAVCGLVWSCWIKARLAGEKQAAVAEEDVEHFSFSADIRSRLDPPVPENYFGNCLDLCFANGKTKQLIGEEGLVCAAQLIAEAIPQKLPDTEAIAGKWAQHMHRNLKRTLTVAGSPKFNYYNIDFGWGKPEKFEIASIDSSEPTIISLGACRDSEVDLEVGFSLAKPELDAFSLMFKAALQSLDLQDRN